MSEVKIIAGTIILCIAMIVGGLTVSTIHRNQLAAEVKKTKAEEGHKFKFGITKENNNETK